jgi:predicted glycosyltransferase
MTVLFVTGHPAQIHNFRIVKRLLEAKGHKVVWVSSKKDISFELLKLYGIKAYEITRPTKGFVSKLKALFVNSVIIFKIIRKEKVDFIVSRVSPFAAIAGKLLGKSHIALADTESSGIYDTIFTKLLDSLITSTTFKRNLRKDQIRINSNIELFYLHPNHFRPNDSIYDYLKISKEEKFVILRFVSWEAYHDKGLTGFNDENKVKAVKEFSKFAKVFISAEGSLPCEIEQHRILIPFDKMHDALYYSSLFFGEGASMAAESSVLGSPAIFLNDNWSGNALDLMKYELFYSYKSNIEDQLKAIEKGVELLSNSDLKSNMQSKLETYFTDKIDASSFLTWFIEEFPNSKKVIEHDITYQNKFK